MEHAGEGHFSMYLERDQTGIGSLIGQTTGDPNAVNTLASMCAQIASTFKRYEQSTSSPSDPSSLIFGIYHSPISSGYVKSTIRKSAENKFSLTTLGVDEWDMSMAIIHQKDPRNPMVVQMAIFMELTSAILPSDDPFAVRQHEPIAVHLEVDVFTYRALVMFAEKAGLRFRFFPTPMHHQFDKHREVCERKGESDRGQNKIKQYVIGQPGQSVEGVVDELQAETASTSMRYHVIAFCAACGEKLHPEKRSQCSQCKMAFYCNAECQKKDWNNLHKKECRKFSKLIAEADCGYCKPRDGAL